MLFSFENYTLNLNDEDDERIAQGEYCSTEQRSSKNVQYYSHLLIIEVER